MVDPHLLASGVYKNERKSEHNSRTAGKGVWHLYEGASRGAAAAPKRARAARRRACGVGEVKLGLLTRASRTTPTPERTMPPSHLTAKRIRRRTQRRRAVASQTTSAMRPPRRRGGRRVVLSHWHSTSSSATCVRGNGRGHDGWEVAANPARYAVQYGKTTRSRAAIPIHKLAVKHLASLRQ